MRTAVKSSMLRITHQRNSKLSRQIKLQAPEGPENDHVKVLEAGFGKLKFYTVIAETSVLFGTQNVGWVVLLASYKRDQGGTEHSIKGHLWSAIQLEKGK